MGQLNGTTKINVTVYKKSVTFHLKGIECSFGDDQNLVTYQNLMQFSLENSLQESNLKLKKIE